MIDFIKKNTFIILVFIVSLSTGFITFLTFIDKSFVSLTELNLQFLLSIDIFLLIVFLVVIFVQIKNSLNVDIDVKGSKTNRKYIAFFALFTLIPSILISIFSLFLFSFALEKYLDKKITTVVNNSYELAKNYVDEVKNRIESDIILIGYDLNRNVNIFYDNPKKFDNILWSQKYLRNVDEIHLIDSLGNLIASTLKDSNLYEKPNEKALEMVFDEERPLKIINAFENQSAAILKLNAYIDTYLYVEKFLDSEISNYLTQSEEAVNFYYTVENKSTGIKISFILIYIIIVTLLLFLSISIAIKFSSRFFRSINNLISASTEIGKGVLDIKVPEIKTDLELETLNKNFNMMIVRLKNQQEKLLITERHEAWESVARKLAHEIKNPLTPIQLTIDRLRSKYSHLNQNSGANEFNNYLKTINKQIKQIENLVNEFSDFARMPKPILKNNNLVSLIKDNIKLINELDNKIIIDFKTGKSDILLNSDSEQLSRVFFNLIKNSIESIQDKIIDNVDLIGKIDISLNENVERINFIIIDNGIGFGIFADNIKDILNPYFTTKKKGTGLGLSIVNKIINDHNGKINFVSLENGAKIEIMFTK
mgnify:CR=1 FL=1